MKSESQKGTQSRSSSLPKLEVLSNKLMIGKIVPPPEKYVTFLANWRYEKQKLPKSLLVIALKEIETELLRNLAFVKKNDENSDFICVPFQKTLPGLAVNNVKVIFSKDNFLIDLTLNAKTFLVSFSQFEKFNFVFEKRAFLIPKFKETVQTFKKMQVQIKDKKRNLEHNVNQFQVLLNYKKKEIEKLEKTYKKYQLSKNIKQNAKSALGRIF